MHNITHNMYIYVCICKIYKCNIHVIIYIMYVYKCNIIYKCNIQYFFKEILVSFECFFLFYPEIDYIHFIAFSF